MYEAAREDRENSPRQGRDDRTTDACGYEHVHVHAGGQAVVPEWSRARGEGIGRISEDQPHAKQIVTCTTPSSLYQFIDLLLAKGRVIRTKPCTYALAGTAPVYLPTCDAIISALTKKKMKLGPLVHHVNVATKNRSRGAITTVLSRLIREGMVKQDRRCGEYRLAGPVRAMRRALGPSHRGMGYALNGRL